MIGKGLYEGPRSLHQPQRPGSPKCDGTTSRNAALWSANVLGPGPDSSRQALPQRIMLAQACLGETSSCWFWSNSATSSSWVEREWNLVYQLKRRSVPYVIDKSPPESVNLIWPRSMLLFGPPVRFTGSVLSGQIRVHRTVAVRSRAGCQVEL